MPLYKPLAIEPAPLPATLRGQPVRLLIRVCDVGVVSIVMRVPFEVENLADLLPFHRPVLENGKLLDEVARDLCAEACKGLQDVMIQSSPPSEPEAYTVFCLNEVGLEKDVTHWLAEHRQAVAELLTETQSNGLGEMQVNEVLRVQRSYTKSDLVVIDWDAALVVDLEGYVVAALTSSYAGVSHARLERGCAVALEAVTDPQPDLA